MAEYNFTTVEKKWQQYWKDHNTYVTLTDSDRPKFYVLDMFPYPSGAGLHVGHPLGYIATDITARYKRAQGYQVLHPMGFDSFGLPAEQYAIKTGQHPAVTTDENIKRFKEQLGVLGFSYDWDKEIRTSDPDYYKWTQWIFLKLFNSYFDLQEQKAKPIETLPVPEELSEKEKRIFIDEHRLAYQAEVSVNWCPDLGTVLSNEEVIGGVSERGGYPVVRKPMRQWMLRITRYSDRLLQGLEGLDWPESIKASQRNWIGKSHGAEIDFKEKSTEAEIRVFTTRPDTIYGVTYMVLAPEHPLVKEITTKEQLSGVEEYLGQASRKSDLERAELDKTKTGVFTGAYAINPINQEEIPIWISDYVLISYGTGAVMAVPGGDQRDFEFAETFDLEIRQVITPEGNPIQPLSEAYPGQGIMLNSEEYNGMKSEDFFKKIVERLENEGHGKATVNYKLRDWVFTRQRYWGEPIPIYHLPDGSKASVPEEELPVVLPAVASYEPSQGGESPLAKVPEWVNVDHPKYGPVKRETNTMPQWAGSCWYYLRYLDPHNSQALADKDLMKKWSPVDLYVGGAEHAVLHLLYARFWHKVLFDLGIVPTNEPFQKLVNQGMIQGRSSFAYRVKDTNKFVSFNLRKDYQTTPIHVDVDLVKQDILDTERFKKWQPDLGDAEFILEDGKYICGSEVEKMSKSKLNVVNPDDIINHYGADTLRIYEMFLGPVEQPKPWSTHGIEGVFKFLRKFWRLFHDEENNFIISEDTPTANELKVSHQTIKKVAEDIERFSFNTAVSSLMICVNELSSSKCHKKAVLEDLVIVLAPFAPHMAEELWQLLGHNESISTASYPAYNAKYLVEESFEYPVSVNGKMRAKMSFALDLDHQIIEQQVLASEAIQKWMEGKTPKKVIIVPKKIVNIVV